MSVTDPLIKDIKGCVQQFIKIDNNNDQISDNNPNFIVLENSLEKIFNKGLITQQNTLYFIRTIDPYAWMSSLTKAKSDIVTLTYKNCIDNVKNRCDAVNNTARFRLLVKFCLMKRCLHVPVEFLLRTNRTHLFYSVNSIIGDEILSEILLSVLLQISKIDFALDLNNSSFLDCTWYIPHLVHMELVPCKYLGLSVSFVENRAVIVHVAPNSVAAENGNIKIGDVLDKLNGIHITPSLKGRLNATLRCKKGEPINISVVKAYNHETKEFFLPIRSLLKRLNIDCAQVLKQYEEETAEEIVPKNACSGYDVKYLGYVDVGSIGNVKQVEKAVTRICVTKGLQAPISSVDGMPVTRVDKIVTFEFGEIGIKVKDIQTKEILLEHSYMQISSCGSTPRFAKNFGYCASIENCDVASHFNCFVFGAALAEDADNILLAIGQGFGRTHYAV
ncbi:uncharacterized protein LOC108916731 [Anoplophora glabripennis]|uniref:uncharacterized protein LOC108916731 n=1 Tax=Anoplophora glabripennis TaxID=217634 RepID=UPI00087533B1|nr:uncharacterized protein LOC108916731 [Anoplophora glabripennis]